MQQLINEVNTFINSPNNLNGRKFRVVRTEFNTYNEVIDWAWNEFKLFVYEGAAPIERLHEACDELSALILDDEDLLSDYQLFLQYGPRKRTWNELINE